MPNKLDITNERYGALVALYDTGEKINGASAWMFQCDCGNRKILPLGKVRYGEIKSCGCHINKKKPTKKPQRIHKGDIFGELTVIETLGQIGNGKHYMSKVQCSCGNEEILRDTFLITKKRVKCVKCMRKNSPFYKHGLTNTRLFNIWQGMRARCYNSNEENYHNYGGRGIQICDEWKDDFHAFYDWAITHGYKEDLWIERNNVNGNYEPLNCSWKTQIEQARNKKNTIYINFEGKKLSIGEIADITGIRSTTIYERIFKYNWDEYDATHIPPDTKYYTSKSMRKTILTNLKTGEIIEFDSTAKASLYVGKQITFFVGKSYKLGNSFIWNDYLVDIQKSFFKGERNE